MSGRPKTVILIGEIDQDALRTLRLTTADLMEALRGKDVFDPRDVSYAVVETNGNLSVARRPEKETTTLADLRLIAERTQATIPFVLDGQILDDNLHWCGKDRAWLERTAEANTLLVEEILLLIGNDTEDYFLMKKQPRRPAGKEMPCSASSPVSPSCRRCSSSPFTAASGCSNSPRRSRRIWTTPWRPSGTKI